jgi:macrolide transport system ATP-binding/permease protein
MRTLRRISARLASLIFRGRAERDLSREIHAHLTLLKDEFEQRGLSPEEAAAAARRAYGGVEQAKELHREARTFLWIEQGIRDVRYGWKNLLRSPGFTLTAVAAVALAVGANTSLFAIYNAVVLKQLPVANPSRVVRIKRWFEHNSSGNIQFTFAYPEYLYLRAHSTVFADLTASSFEMPALASSAGEVPEHLRGHAVSANYFAAMGVQALIGRTFLPEEDRSPGGNPVVVLSHEFWQRKYLGDRNVIGRSVTLNGTAYAVIGVAPPAFTGTDVIPTESAFWVPVSMVRQLDPGLDPVLDHWYEATHTGFQLLARLKDGVSVAAAQAETGLLLRQFLAGYHQSERTTTITLRRTSYFDDDGFLSGFRQLTHLGTVLVSLVLLAACANVANMLLARGVTRQREISIRLALGAGRARVIRQLLTESLLLAFLGGAAGVAVAFWAGKLLWISVSHGLQTFDLHVSDLDFTPDVRLFSYGAAMALLTAVLFGLVPAFKATRQVPSGASNRSRLKSALLASQVAVATLLLSGAGELFSVAHIKASEQGFETHDTYLLNIHTDNLMSTNRRLRERLATLPELTSAAIGGWPLVGDSFFSPMAAGNLNRAALVTYESDGYFETMGIPILEGRGFTREEADQGAPVALISRATARHYWPGRDPLHQRFGLDRGPQSKLKDFEVVGVAGDIRFRDVAVPDASHVFLPLMAAPGEINGGVVLRIPIGGRDRAITSIQSVVESVDRNLLPDMQIMSFEEGPVAMHGDVDRVVYSVVGIVMLISLALAGVGIYGVAAFLVSQRTKEIGIRMALGATSLGVVRHVLGRSGRGVLIGVVVGLAGSVALGVVNRSQQPFPDTVLHSLFGDPFLYAALGLLAGITVLATIVPARRAAQVDPMVALRYE